MRDRHFHNLIVIIVFFICLLHPLVSECQVHNGGSSDTNPLPDQAEKVYFISASSGEGGKISPSGRIPVQNGANQSFTIKPDPCYYIASISVDGSSLAVDDRSSLSSVSYNFTDVTSDHTISVTFQRIIYKIIATTSSISSAEVEASAPSHGDITPSGTVEVYCGDDQTFTIKAHSGHRVRDVLVDNESQGAMNSYTFRNVISNHRIVAVFEPDISPAFYRITVSAGDGGDITPSGVVRVNRGRDQTFAIEPHEGYHVESIIVDGLAMEPADSYTFENVTSDHTIAAAFGINIYTIQASAGIGGSISPSGTLRVGHGKDAIFTITPESCYHISEILVDGKVTAPNDTSTNMLSSFTLANITSNHTINVIFEKRIYNITATPGLHGSIQPSGVIQVVCGADQTFTIAPDESYYIADTIVDGSSVGVVESYTFLDVKSDHTIEAQFEKMILKIAEVRDSTEGIPQKAGSVITVFAIQEIDSLPAQWGEFYIGDAIMDGMLYNDGTHGDLLSGDGIWTGQYEINQGDDVESASVIARLYATDEVAEKSGIDRVTIDTISPSISSIAADPDPAGEGDISITVFFHEDGSGMDENIPLSVYFVTSDGETASVSGVYTNMNTWQGTGEILGSNRDGKATIIAHGGQDRAGNSLSPPEAAAYFWIDIIEEIEWVQHDAVAPLKTGDVLNVVMNGEAGKVASFQIEGIAADLGMNETEPGIYEGSYTIRKGDNAEAAHVICYLGGVTEIADSVIIIDTNNPGAESILVEPELTREGNVTIAIAFTEEMNMDIKLSVAFAPANSGQIIAVNGSYEDNRAWRGMGLITAELENGAVKVVMSGAQDEAGNPMELYEEFDAFIIDTIPPDESQARILINGGVEYTNSRTLEIAWNGFVDQHSIDGYYYSLIDGSGTSNGIYTEKSTAVLVAPEDQATVYVWARDKAGNIGSASNGSISIDVEPPIVTQVVAPEIIVAGQVAINIQFHDNISGMSDDSTGIKVEILLQNSLSKIPLEMESYSSDGLWSGKGTAIDGMNDDAAVLAISGAKDMAGNVMLVNRDNHLIIDTQLPDSPDNFTAEADAGGLIGLEWQPSKAPDVRGYTIYQISPSKEILEDQIPGSSTEHALNMEDGTYRFGISAIDRAGNEGEISLSNFTEVDGTAPNDVTVLTSESLPWGKIRLSWVPSSSTDTVLYEIYFDSEVKVSEGITWTSDQLEDNRLYTFTVKAVDEVGNKSQGISTERQAIHNEPPAVEIISAEKSGSEFSIKYRLSDREAEDLSIICEYAESGQWHTASVDGKTEGIADYNGEIIWNSRENIPSANGVYAQFRITPEDSEQKGEPGDIEIEITNILGDYNDDEKVDFVDLSIFQKVWNDQDISRELGPSTGEPPELILHPDGVIDFEDLVAFGLMWKWSSNRSSTAPINLVDAHNIWKPKPAMEIYEDKLLKISLPTGAFMGNINIKCDPNIRISAPKLSSASSAMFLTNTDNPGQITLAFVDPAPESHKDSASSITVSLEWEQYAEDVKLSCHYDLRDHNNQRLSYGLQEKTIKRLARASALLQNYPNPFNPETWIPYHLRDANSVVIRIYNSTGQLLRTLNLGYKDAGLYVSRQKAAYWDGKNESGEAASSGIYFCSIQSGDFSAMRKIILSQ